MSKLPLFDAVASVSVKVDCDLVPVFQDSAQKAVSPKGTYTDLVDRLRKSGPFAARANSIQFIRFAGKGSSENVLFFGLGSASEVSAEKLRVAGANVWTRMLNEKIQTAVVHVDLFLEAKGRNSELSPVKTVRAFAEGLILNAYQLNTHKSESEGEPSSSKNSQRPEILFVTRDKVLKSALASELAQVSAIGEAINVTRDWSNEPSNFGTPIYYANEAKKLARKFGLKCNILTEKDAAREKMGLFLGVGQGSSRESRIVVVEYAPKGAKKSKALKTVAIVGKGVTFDSGGISIKPSLRMEDMKHDMTGAATIMGATLLAASWNCPNRVIGIMAFVENMPDGDAIQPGNVLKSRNGKTVEVINTDAEGRLVLADVLDYAQDFKPDAIVDVATLTGAVLVALGKRCCAVFGNDAALVDSIRRSADTNGEKMWELPLWDEYFDDLRSDSADMKNSANDAYGGCIRGAIFLKQFIKKGTLWAHLDIAGTGYGNAHIPYFPKRGASGAYVRTLAQFVSDF